MLLTASLLTAFAVKAANIEWQGGTASYTTAADWVGGVVPGVSDNAINDNGSNNVVQINLGNPDWTLNQILAGNAAGNGAFAQNGQMVTLTGVNSNGPVATVYVTPFRLGVSAADTGVYTLNGGTNNYNTGAFDIGELGSGVLNINGGLITGSGNFADNNGAPGVPVSVNATVGGGVTEGDFTWFEQGYYAPNASAGFPHPGSTIISLSQTNHSFTLPSSYTANNAAMVSTNETSATISLTAPAACSGLSFLCTSGNGQTVVNYTVHHADSSTETGSLTIPDWFGPGTANEVLAVGSRVDALGVNFQFPGPANGFTGNAPYLWSLDIALTNTTSAVTSVGLSYVSGGVADVMALSTSTGSSFSPVGITGFNQDVVVEAAAQNIVSGSITDVVTQTAGAVNVTGGGQLFVGNYGTAIYNLSGGSVDVHNYIALGRSGGNGTLNMTGGTFNQDGGGNLLVGTGYNAPSGASAVGVLNQSGGTINDQSQFLCPENAPSTGTYNLSGTGSLIVNNWLVFGRGGGAGVLNMTGGSILQTNSGGNFEVGEGTSGTVNQSAGSVTTYNELWIGQAGGSVGVYNLSGTGTVTVNNWLAIGRAGGNGTLNLTNGVVTKIGNGGNHITIGSGGPGVINQYGGLITNTTSDFFLGETASGTWNLNGGTAVLGNLVMCVSGSATATLNLNGGLLQASGISSPTAGTTVSLLSLNGVTLQANANNPNFISGLYQVTAGPTATVIDSQGYNIGIPQALIDNGGGGITKNGSGTLTLSGVNSYAGPTLVNAGTLITGTSSTGAGSYSVADAAGLGVTSQAANGQLNASTVTLGSSTGVVLGFNLSNFGNPTAAPLNVTGTFTANGTIMVNIGDALPQLGEFPLVKYPSGGRAGNGNFVLGSLPVGVTATILTNTVNNSIDLNITGVNQPRWDGEAGGTWDIGLTTNWVNIGTATPTYYTEGSPVVFDDNALGTTTVNLTTAVHPHTVTVTNNTLSYTFVGAGKISGSIGLTKSGASTLAILNPGNDYTGPTVIAGGTLSVTNLVNGGSPSPIGASSANPANLVINGGTFSYAGAPVTVNRGYQANNGTIDAEGNFTLTGSGQTVSGTLYKTGPATMTYGGTGTNLLSPANIGGAYQVQNGTVVLDGSAGSQTNTVIGEIWVGGTPTYGGNLVLTNTSLGVSSWLGLGRGNGTINNTSTMTLYNSKATFGNVSLGYWNGIVGNFASQFLSLNGNSSLIDYGDMNLAESSGSTATIYIGGTSVLSSQNRCFLAGVGGTNCNASMTVANSGSFTIVNGWFSIANNNGSTGSLMVQDNGVVTVHGDFNITDVGSGSATMVVSNNADVENYGGFYVGKGSGATGVASQYGGTVHPHNNGNQEFQVGGSGTGTYNLYAGNIISDSKWFAVGRQVGSTGYLNVLGGTVTVNNNALLVGEGGTGTLTISNTASVTSTSDFIIGNSDGNGTGTVNLDGGLLSVPVVHTFSTSPSTFNFNGGTLQARGNQTGFMSGLTAANVLGGGATIDSGAYTIGIAQPLLNGGGGGGLTKEGSGTLYLNGINTYTGSTLVSTGVLAGVGSIAGPVTVASGATLAAGMAPTNIGTLSISNTLTFAAGSASFMKVNLTTNDQIAGLTGVAYNGSLVVQNISGSPLIVGHAYPLFSSSAAGSGNFVAVTILPSGAGTFNPSTGVLTITAGGTGMRFNSAKASGGNLILNGTGGVPGSGYTVLTATNLTTPLSAWTTNSTGTMDGSGAFSNSVPVSLSQPAAFYRVRVP